MTTLRISTKLIEKQDQEVDSLKVCLFVKVVDCGSLHTVHIKTHNGFGMQGHFHNHMDEHAGLERRLQPGGEG